MLMQRGQSVTLSCSFISGQGNLRAFGFLETFRSPNMSVTSTWQQEAASLPFDTIFHSAESLFIVFQDHEQLTTDTRRRDDRARAGASLLASRGRGPCVELAQQGLHVPQ
jgi:hypothetical protein